MTRSKKLLSRFRSFVSQQLNLIYPPLDIRIFCPDSSGTRTQIAQLTTLSARQTLPLLADLSEQLFGSTKIHTIADFTTEIGSSQLENAERLKDLLNHYQSDKASTHDYHLVYAAIFSQQSSMTGLLEIGLGTNDVRIVSNMGTNGRPGASLRAFRDFLPDVNIYGGDIDRSIRFQEERIATFYVDQTDSSTFAALDASILHDIQIIIDDGLHAPNANLTTLLYGLRKMKGQQSGWVIIEDIPLRILPLWKSVGSLLSNAGYKTYLVQTKQAFMFIVHQHSLTNQ